MNTADKPKVRWTEDRCWRVEGYDARGNHLSVTAVTVHALSEGWAEALAYTVRKNIWPPMPGERRLYN